MPADRTPGLVARINRKLTSDWPLAALNWSLPTRHLHIHVDQPYGADEHMMADVYTPARREAPLPVIVFFYGGRWQRGSRRDYKFVAQCLASHGYCCVVADYRRFPDVQFPAFMHDAGHALAWAAEHVEQFGGDPNNIFLMGHSAGAHIATMLALNPSFRPAFDEAGHRVRGLIGMSGPYDFLPMTDEDVIAVFGDKATSMESQPIHYAGAHAPPALLISSERDIVVRPGNAFRLSKALKSHGILAEVELFNNLTHAGTVLALAPPFRRRAPVVQRIQRFTADHQIN